MGKNYSQGFLFSLRSKLTIFIAVFIGLISAFIFIYFPSEFEKREIQVLTKKANELAYNISVTAGSVISKKSDSLDEILHNTIISNQVAYLIASEDSGFIYKSYNYESLFPPDSSLKNINPLLKVSSPVIKNGNKIGTVYVALSLSDLYTHIFKLKITIGVISITFFLGGFITVFFVSSIVTKPISGIIKASEKIAAGDYTKRITYKGKGELGALTSSFNSLAYKLEKANSSIENLTRQVKTIYQDKIGELNLEINQRRLAEYSLRRSEEQFRLLFELAPIGMVITSLRHEIQKTNKAFCSTLGYSDEELNQKCITELSHKDDVEKEIELHDQLLLGKQSAIYFEKRFFRKDNEVIYALVESVLVRDDKGTPIHFIRQVLDITERKKVEQELIRAKNKAEESDRLKSAFLAQMSHEIRTPLNIILNAIPLLAEEFIINQTEADPLIDAVNSAGKRLLRTIDLILNLSSVQTGNYKPEFEEVEIDKELCKLIEEFRHLSYEKNITLNFYSYVSNPKVLADRYTLNQIFQNLIGNAFKYTLKGSIDISIYKNDEEVICVDIKDTGIGISQNYLSKIFSPFSQEDIGHKREFEGNGLGLALVKEYSKINNAEIMVHSEKDVGSVFTLKLKNTIKPVFMRVTTF